MTTASTGPWGQLKKRGKANSDGKRPGQRRPGSRPEKKNQLGKVRKANLSRIKCRQARKQKGKQAFWPSHQGGQRNPVSKIKRGERSGVKRHTILEGQGKQKAFLCPVALRGTKSKKRKKPNITEAAITRAEQGQEQSRQGTRTGGQPGPGIFEMHTPCELGS